MRLAKLDLRRTEKVAANYALFCMLADNEEKISCQRSFKARSDDYLDHCCHCDAEDERTQREVVKRVTA